MNVLTTSNGFAGNSFATREDWVRALAVLVAPAAARLRPETAHLHLPGGVAQYGGNAARLERFARVLVPAALMAHATKDASALAHFARALAVGVDRNSPYAWGFPGDRDQRVVEICFVKQALAIAPRELLGKPIGGVPQRACGVACICEPR